MTHKEEIDLDLTAEEMSKKVRGMSKAHIQNLIKLSNKKIKEWREMFNEEYDSQRLALIYDAIKKFHDAKMIYQHELNVRIAWGIKD